uniref:Uncharacterized protein n=1 Tax=Onchocerca volvulus TaxID=6282 RepID=A0A8R1XNJ9_ONCVO
MRVVLSLSQIFWSDSKYYRIFEFRQKIKFDSGDTVVIPYVIPIAPQMNMGFLEDNRYMKKKGFYYIQAITSRIRWNNYNANPLLLYNVNMKARKTLHQKESTNVQSQIKVLR